MEYIFDTYTDDKCARAILRSGISTLNEEMKMYLADENMFNGYALRSVGIQNVLFNNMKYSKADDNVIETYDAINTSFFYALPNAKGEFLKDVRAVLNYGGDLESDLLNSDPNETINFGISKKLQELYLTVASYERKVAREFEQKNDINSHHYEYCKFLAKEKMQKEIDSVSNKIVNDYLYNNPKLKEERPIYTMEQLIDFVKIMINKTKGSSVYDFLDTYSLFHYYIFRKKIQLSFRYYQIEHPSASKEELRNAFEDICNRCIKKHAIDGPYIKNLFFDKSKLGVVSDPINSETAKSVCKILAKKGNEAVNETLEYIDSVANSTVPQNSNLHVCVSNVLITNTPSIDKEPLKGYILKTDNIVLFPFDKDRSKSLTLRTRLDATLENSDGSNSYEKRKFSNDYNSAAFNDMKEYEQGKKYLPGIPNADKKDESLTIASQTRKNILSLRANKKLEEQEHQKWNDSHQLNLFKDL